MKHGLTCLVVLAVFGLPHFCFGKDSSRKPARAGGIDKSYGKPMTVFCRHNQDSAFELLLERNQTYWSGTKDMGHGSELSVIHTAEGEMWVKTEIEAIAVEAYGSNLGKDSVVSLLTNKGGVEVNYSCSLNKKALR